MKRFLLCLTLAFAGITPAMAADGARLTVDANTTYEGRKFGISVDNTIDMLVLTDRNLTKRDEVTDAMVESAASQFVAPANCRIAKVYREQIQRISIWQAYYTCPDNIDLRKLILDQRTSLKKGASISIQTAQ